MEKLIRVTSSYFCAGVIAKNEIIINAAPILKYMIGWNAITFKNYCIKKGFKID